jgi:catechol 2,3-dioxygenase-like lactoylglutathione lyase family enzyme
VTAEFRCVSQQPPGRTRSVTIDRAVPNIRSDRAAETRDFFVGLLGFDVAMDLGWVVTVASPTNPSAQVTIISNDDPAAPGISVGVDDVDAIHADALKLGLEIVYPPRDEEWGIPTVHAARTERHDREHRLPPRRLTAACSTRTASSWARSRVAE